MPDEVIELGTHQQFHITHNPILYEIVHKNLRRFRSLTTENSSVDVRGYGELTLIWSVIAHL